MLQKSVEDRPPGNVFILSLVLFVLFWAGLAALKADRTVLPDPLEVARVLQTELASGRLIRDLLATLSRVAAAFAFAMALGIPLGVLLGRYQRFNHWADPWVTIFMNLPALVLIVLCYLWIGLNEVAAVAAVTLNKTAMVMVTVRQGAGLRISLFRQGHLFKNHVGLVDQFGIVAPKREHVRTDAGTRLHGNAHIFLNRQERKEIG